MKKSVSNQSQLRKSQTVVGRGMEAKLKKAHPVFK